MKKPFNMRNNEVKYLEVNRKSFRKSLAVLLAGILAAGMCMPVYAGEDAQIPAEEPSETNQEEVQEEYWTTEDTQNSEETRLSAEETTGEDSQEEEDSEKEMMQESDEEHAASAEEVEYTLPEEVSEEATEGTMDAISQTEGALEEETELPEDILLEDETSEWLSDYTYTVEEDRIILTHYNGTEKDIRVPGTAVVGGIEYNTVQIGRKVWARADRLTFDNGVVFPENSSELLYGISGLKEVDASKVDTSNVTNMSDMFGWCRSLKTVDVSGFDTSNVTDMSYMFSDCNLSSLDLSGFDTSNVTSMLGMFDCCEKLTSINLSSFDTSNVTDMSRMFDNCRNLTELDVSGFDTSNVTDTSLMFNGCECITVLDLSSFDTSNVNNMEGMFQGCANLTSVDLSSFDTSNVENMNAMFYYCKNLSSADLGSFNTSNVTDMSEMFNMCSSLMNLEISGFNTSNVTNMSRMFSECSSLTRLDLSGFDTSNVTDMQNMFSYCGSLTELDLSGFRTPNVREMGEMFLKCKELTELDLSGFDLAQAYSSSKSMLSGCSALAVIHAPVNVEYEITLPYPFYDEEGNIYSYLPYQLWKSIVLTKVSTSEWLQGYEYSMSGEMGEFSIDLKSYSGDETDIVVPGSAIVNGIECSPVHIGEDIWTESGVTSLSFEDGVIIPSDCYFLFGGLGSLTSLNLDEIDTSYVTNMMDMFYDCESLTELDLSGFDTSNVTSMCSMFYNCRSLTELDLSGFDTAQVTDMYGMFEDCSSLTSLDMSSFDLSKVSETKRMFLNCSSLMEIKAPVGLTQEVALPGTYVGTDGEIYTKLPLNLEESIELVRISTETSDPAGWDIPVVYKNPEDVSVPAGTAVTLSVSAIGNGLTYQWQYQGVSSTKWNNFANASGAEISRTIAGSWDGWKVRCIVTDQDGDSIISGTALITVVSKITITEQPTAVTTPAGRTIVFSVSAESYDGGTLSYQWQYQGVSSTKWNNFANATSETMTKTTARSWNGWKVRCVVTDADGNSKATDTALITIVPAITIKVQPESVTTASGRSVTFSTTAESYDGGTLSYQWQYQGVSSTKWNNFANATSETMTKTTARSWNGWKVRCVVTDAQGTSQASENAVITIVPAITITVQPESVTTAPGRSVTFSTTAESYDGGTLSYQWQYQGVSSTRWNNFVNATSETMTKTAARSWNGWKVRCLVTDAQGTSQATENAVITIDTE